MTFSVVRVSAYGVPDARSPAMRSAAPGIRSADRVSKPLPDDCSHFRRGCRRLVVRPGHYAHAIRRAKHVEAASAVRLWSTACTPSIHDGGKPVRARHLISVEGVSLSVRGGAMSQTSDTKRCSSSRNAGKAAFRGEG